MLHDIMYEVTFRLAEGGQYTETTHRRNVSLEVWCNNHCDLLRVRGDDRDLIREEIEEIVGIQQALETPDELLIITGECLIEITDDSVMEHLNRHNCLLLPPLRYRDGAKFSRVVALDSKSLTDLFQALSDDYHVEIINKKEVQDFNHNSPLITRDKVLPDLSSRQQEVFLAARDLGYYKIPRDTTTDEIAEQFGIDRRTVEEHLRRAENKIANSVAEYYI
jgi:predicted DNA binding protein